MTPKVIAEIGCNHKGSMDIAYECIKEAAIFSNVDVIKFQKRNVKEVLTKEEYNTPHPVPYNSYGATYGEHREALELNIEQHRQLKKWCEEFGKIYSTSVWDMTSASEIVSLNPEIIKVPSACNTYYKMLEYLCDKYEGEIHLSFGMTTKVEEEEIISFFEAKKRNMDLVIYHCTSGYPITMHEATLMEIARLEEKFGDRVKAIGYSGHHNGIAIDNAALVLGATWFERHFTLNRTWKGTDHAASLEPDGMRRLVRNLHATCEALCYKESDLLDVEKVQRKKLKWDRKMEEQNAV